jgi:hypothetical protein
MGAVLSICVVLMGCSSENMNAILDDAGKLASKTAVLAAGEAIAAQLEGKTVEGGRIPVGEAEKILPSYDALSTVLAPDADGDGFVDGNRIEIRVQEQAACIRFGTEGAKVLLGACQAG